MTGSKSFDMYTNVFINISDISALDLCVAINSDCHHYSNLLGFLYHSSEIKGLRSTKSSSERLQNLLYLMYKKTHVVFFVFHFVQLFIFTL